MENERLQVEQIKDAVAPGGLDVVVDVDDDMSVRGLVSLDSKSSGGEEEGNFFLKLLTTTRSKMSSCNLSHSCE